MANEGRGGRRAFVAVGTHVGRVVETIESLVHYDGRREGESKDGLKLECVGGCDMNDIKQELVVEVEENESKRAPKRTE